MAPRASWVKAKFAFQCGVGRLSLSAKTTDSVEVATYTRRYGLEKHIRADVPVTVLGNRLT